MSKKKDGAREYAEIHKAFSDWVIQLEANLPKIKALVALVPDEKTAKAYAQRVEELMQIFQYTSTYELSSRIHPLKDQLLAIRDKERLSGPFVWSELIKEGDLSFTQSQELYRAKQNWAASQFKGISLSGGYNTETLQNVVRIAMDAKATDADIMSMFQYLQEHIIGHIQPGKNGLGLIDLFESTLSQHGSYYLHVSQDGSIAKLLVTRYGRESLVFEGTLLQVLSYCAKHHPYSNCSSYDGDDYDLDTD